LVVATAFDSATGRISHINDFLLLQEVASKQVAAKEALVAELTQLRRTLVVVLMPPANS
jgi:hypothetical protein